MSIGIKLKLSHLSAIALIVPFGIFSWGCLSSDTANENLCEGKNGSNFACASASKSYPRDASNLKAFAKDKIILAGAGSVKMDGIFGEQLDRSLKGDIMAWDIDDLVRPFAERKEIKMWQIEFWGKWHSSAALAYNYAPSEKLDERLCYSVNELMKTQGKDGSITSYTAEREYMKWDVWGRKYVLLGMIAEYDRAGDPRVLASAKRAADAIMRDINENGLNISEVGEWQGLAATSILEPMVLLYRRSGDKKYLDYAEWIVKTWSSKNGPDLVNKALDEVSVLDMFEHPNLEGKDYSKFGKSKAYEMMSCYEGLLELYRVTGKQAYLKAVEKLAKNVFETEIVELGSGSIHERWCGGASIQTFDNAYWMETCVTSTWLKLCAQLFRYSGETKYFDMIERTAYNALIASQKEDGSWWAHYNVMNGVRKAAPEQCKMHMNCCVANGPRGLFLIPSLAYSSNVDNILVNLYEKGSANIPLYVGSSIQGEMSLKVSEIDFLENDTATINIESLWGKISGISLRIPEWSKNTIIYLNGKKLEKAPKAGRYYTIEGVKKGDEIKVRFDLSTRVVRDTGDKGEKLKIRESLLRKEKIEKMADKYCLMRGPYVLAQDIRFEKNLDKPAAISVDENDIAKEVKTSVKDGVNVISVKLEDGSFRNFIPYFRAGETWSEDSRFAVWFSR